MQHIEESGAAEAVLDKLEHDSNMRESRQLLDLHIPAGRGSSQDTGVSLRSTGMVQLYLMWIPCFLMNATGG